VTRMTREGKMKPMRVHDADPTKLITILHAWIKGVDDVLRAGGG
jgi:hypothetical protein